MNFNKPLIMGILNVTPDSFSDGGRFNEVDAAMARIQEMIDQGADIIDMGGESTGPGSKDVELDHELARLKPVIDRAHELGFTEKLPFSIDTYKAPVAEYALEHGFKIVNDVTCMRGDSQMKEVLVRHKPYVVLMYSKDPTARTTPDKVEYDDVVVTIKDFLTKQTGDLLAEGFPEDHVILDPGMGAFISGDPKYSFEIIDRLKELEEMKHPLLIGISRKSCLGVPLEERDQPSVDWSMKAIQNGAAIIRIHNVPLLKKALH